MKKETKLAKINSEILEAELTAILEGPEQDHCPKCKNLLTEASKFEGKIIFHCWGCGLEGTYQEMTKQAEQANQRVYENASQVACSLCGNKGVIGHDLRPKTLYGEKYPQGRSMFICFKCMPEK